MRASLLGEGQGEPTTKCCQKRLSPSSCRIVGETVLSGCAASASVNLGPQTRIVVMITPRGRASFGAQAEEAMAALETVLLGQPRPMIHTTQTVFLRDSTDQPLCEEILARHAGSALPVTNFVLQPPCDGAALAIEAWAIGGESVEVERFGPEILTVSYGGVRWIHCGGIQSRPSSSGTYAQTLRTLRAGSAALARAGSSFEQVARTWFYLGGITEPEAKTHRYAELNRARSDFYRGLRFCSSLAVRNEEREMYPASTGIGMSGHGLVLSCLALETQRKDVVLVPLENPRQTPAYAYDSRYSSQSPKFSRASALCVGNCVTTWISGTASIVNSESCHPADIEKQTEQTIENIRSLIAPENFAAHGLKDAGAGLEDLAKIRVYLKRAEDLIPCQAVCRRHFGDVPAIYALANICRPELLVEIEGVAFSAKSTRS